MRDPVTVTFSTFWSLEVSSAAFAPAGNPTNATKAAPASSDALKFFTRTSFNTVFAPIAIYFTDTAEALPSVSELLICHRDWLHQVWWKRVQTRAWPHRLQFR